MSSGKTIGGILVLVSAALILFDILFYTIGLDVPLISDIIISNLVVLVLVLVGGIQAVKGEKRGGWIALIGGLVWLIGDLLCFLGVVCVIICASALYFLIPTIIMYFGIVEVALIIAGAITILVSGND